MFKIGDFSRLNKISVKALRYYDELDILKPMKVDEQTGYRYYSASQLPRLNRILALKDLGFSLNQISIMLDNNFTTDTVISMLNIKRNEIEENIKSEEIKLSRLQTLISKIKEEENVFMLNYDVIIKEVDSLKVASIRDIIPDYSKQHHLWQELMSHLGRHNIKVIQPCVAIYYDPGYKESDVDIEVCEHIIGNAPETDRIKVKELEAVKEMACVIHKGSYENLTNAYTVLQKWIEDNNYKIAGANRELYLEGEWSKHSPDEYITEIQIPVTKCL
ncbi:MerR family transcriptional regulator [Clostridium sp. DJ247]|uniref:MerR family transcriptional regulator n=1 Tax=Clostridium sp. DJ247 TaxID=2726188 RepID=UPI001626DD4F|nr:MerR family transcriptional regulator [Clostridium sp. DJ247]MBC2578817.1 MerR family transcriptional regulator [Clostridium sp. DJ247]